MHLYEAFTDELKKLAAKREVAQLLSGLAKRRGIDPSAVPSIQQVANIAGRGERPRAAQVAQNVRGFLKNAPRTT